MFFIHATGSRRIKMAAGRNFKISATVLSFRIKPWLKLPKMQKIFFKIATKAKNTKLKDKTPFVNWIPLLQR